MDMFTDEYGESIVSIRVSNIKVNPNDEAALVYDLKQAIERWCHIDRNGVAAIITARKSIRKNYTIGYKEEDESEVPDVIYLTDRKY